MTVSTGSACHHIDWLSKSHLYLIVSQHQFYAVYICTCMWCTRVSSGIGKFDEIHNRIDVRTIELMYVQ